MALILNIETSSTTCSVALSHQSRIIDFKEDTTKNAHARVLTLLITELLNSNNTQLSQLNAVAVSAGPGSYTGLRIGVSTAKGLCYALQKPLIAVPTLQAMATGLSGHGGANTLPLMDARRMDVYAALYSAAGAELLPAALYTLNEEFFARITALGPVVLGGSGAAKCQPLMPPSASVVYGPNTDCHATLMAKLAAQMFEKQQFEDVAYFEPLYINEFQAKLPKAK